MIFYKRFIGSHLYWILRVCGFISSFYYYYQYDSTRVGRYAHIMLLLRNYI